MVMEARIVISRNISNIKPCLGNGSHFVRLDDCHVINLTLPFPLLVPPGADRKERVRSRNVVRKLLFMNSL